MTIIETGSMRNVTTFVNRLLETRNNQIEDLERQIGKLVKRVGDYSINELRFHWLIDTYRQIIDLKDQEIAQYNGELARLRREIRGLKYQVYKGENDVK